MAKRIFALMLVLALVFSIAACKGDETSSDPTASDVAVETVTSGDSSTDDKTTSETESKDDKTESKTESKTQTSSKQNGSKVTASKVTASKIPAPPQVSNKDKVIIETGEGSVAAAGDLKIGKGKSIIKGLDFGGATYQMAITNEPQYHTTSFTNLVAAFEKQYNCKIELKEYPFFEYNQYLSNAIKGGGDDVPEICFIHGYFFINATIDGLYQDLSNYVKEGDLMNTKNPAKGGFDPAKTSYFAWNSKIYGVADYEAVYPYLMYYNKAEAEAKDFDPRALAAKGQWTWDRIYTTGRAKKFTDAGNDIYFLDYHVGGRLINLSYGAPVTIFKDGKFVSNLTSPAYTAGLKMLQKLYTGNQRVGDPKQDTSTTETYFNDLYDKKVFLSAEESAKFTKIAQIVPTKSSFDKKISNIGIVQVPLGGGNKLYPTGWITATAAPVKTDARVAMAFGLFKAEYTPARNKYQMSKEDEKYTLDLMKKGIICPVAQFSTSSDSSEDIQKEIWASARKGASIDSLLANDKRIQKCIDTATKKLK